ncbi:MAG TPA: metallophosphoesterase [Gemmatimonadaceae bacterium]|nr:metallophosphoesterase [Gemmatimonadaceae bacterium]
MSVVSRNPSRHRSTSAARSLTRASLCILSLAGVVACRHRVSLEELPPDQIETTLFLIGDAGEPDPRNVGLPLDSLTAQASVAPERTMIVFLGDNVYPGGIPEEGAAEWADARRRLEAQVRSIPPGVRGIFLPGNHDWADETAFGLYSIRLQERMIASLAQGRNVRMLPGNGCPGPVSIDVGRLRFVAIDTQWWLHSFIVRDSSSHCPTGTMASVTEALREQVRPPGQGRVVFVGGHHPLMTGGLHGGYCGATGPFRRFGGRSQDIISSANRTMRDSIRAAFAGHPPLVAVGGHDHTLQVLRGGLNLDYILVSGAGSASKTECAVRLRESYYVSQHRAGFMRVDIMKGKGVLLRVFHYPAGPAGPLTFSRWLEVR